MAPTPGPTRLPAPDVAPGRSRRAAGADAARPAGVARGEVAPGREPAARGLRASRVPVLRPAGGLALTTEPGDRDELVAERAGRSGQSAGSAAGLPRAARQREARADELPAAASALLRRPGRPLASDVRERLEVRTGRVLSDVRVHDGAEAGAAARELGAAAFTFGRHVALAPETPASEELLAHEVGHVIAPPRDALVGRQTPQTVAGGPTTDDPDVRLRRWLEAHQLAPPEQQPDGGERHVLLNGEDMPISQAAALASQAVGRPAADVQPVIAAAVNRAVPASLLGATYVGAGNEIPGLTVRRGAGGLPRLSAVDVGRAADIGRIDAWLDEHGFSTPDVRDPTGDRAYLDGQATTIEQIADRIIALYTNNALGGVSFSYLSRQEILDHLRQRYVAARGGPSNQIVFGYTLIPAALQPTSGTPDPLNPPRTQHQFSFTITRQHHPGDSPGLESSFQGAVSIDDGGHLTNLQAGGQEAIVLPLLQGWIQVSGLVQTMVMANWTKTVIGSVAIAPAIQTAAGGQVLLTPNPRTGPFRFLRGHVQIGVQALATVTVPLSSGPVQAGAQGGLVINIPF